MKKNSLTKQITLLAAVLLSGIFTSCVYDKDVETKAAGGDGKLIININSSAVGAGLRATTITDGNSSTNSTAEKTISTLAIGIFNSAGDTKKDFKYLENLSGTTDNWSTVTEHSGTSIAAGDLVLVAVNVPTTVANALENAATTTAFRGELTTIDQAMIFADSYTAAQTIDAAKLPMYGSGTVEADDVANKNFKVTVNVIHMVSKVTLGALTVSGNASYQFKLTQAFLINVPEKLDFGFTTDGNVTTYGFAGVGTNFFQGESAAVQTAAEAMNPALTTRDFRDYLGTEPALNKTVTTASALDVTYTFYTMPNNSAANDTRLVLKGQWSEDAGTNWEDVWYSIQLRNVDTGVDVASAAALRVYPNRHYVLNVDIQRKGQTYVTADATGAYNGLSTQSAVNATYTVSDWSDGSKSTEFGGNGGTQSEN